MDNKGVKCEELGHKSESIKFSAISISQQKPNIKMTFRQANYNNGWLSYFLPCFVYWHITTPILFLSKGKNSSWESEILWKSSSILSRERIAFSDIGYYHAFFSQIKSGLGNMWQKLKKKKMLYLELTVQTWCSWRVNDWSLFNASWRILH